MMLIDFNICLSMQPIYSSNSTVSLKTLFDIQPPNQTCLP